MKQKKQQQPFVIPESFLNDMSRVGKLLDKYWPGVHGKLHPDKDGTWRICIQPGEWIKLGKTDEEISAYLSTHPMTQEKVMADFTKSIESMLGGGSLGGGFDLNMEMKKEPSDRHPGTFSKLVNEGLKHGATMNQKKDPMREMVEATRKTLGVPFKFVEDSGKVTFDSETYLNQKPDARVRISCRCGNKFIALIPASLIRTTQKHKCTACPRVFKTQYQDGKGWTVAPEKP